MSYKITRSDGTSFATVDDRSLDNAVTPITLIGRGAYEYGEAFDQNLIYLLENFANTSSPRSALRGQLWYDTNAAQLNCFDGVSWSPLATIGAFGDTTQVHTGTTLGGAASGTNRVSGATGFAITSAGGSTTTISATIAEGKIISATSAEFISQTSLPEFVTIRGLSFAVRDRFPSGISSGITLATDPTPYVYMGLGSGLSASLNALTAEANTRQLEVNDLIQTLTNLAYSLNDNKTAISQLQTIVQNDALQSAQSITDITAVLGQNRSAILSESTTRTTLTDSFAQQLTLLAANVATNTAAILEQKTVSVDQTSASASTINALQVAVGAAKASIIEEQTARVTAVSALADQFNSLSVSLNKGLSQDGQTVISLAAQITTEKTARIDGQTALANQITALSASVDKNSASITDEQTTRADLVSSLAQRITTLNATVATNSAAITNEQTARADAQSVLTQTISSLQATVDGNSASISAINTASSTTSTSTASQISALQANIASNLAAIQNEATARANADSSNVSAIMSVSTSANKQRIFFQPTAPTGAADAVWFNSSDGNKTYSWNGSSWMATADTGIAANAAAITSLSSSTTTQFSSISTRFDGLISTVAGNTATITNNAKTASDATSAVANSVSALQATYTGGGNDIPNSDLNGADTLSVNMSASGFSSGLNYTNTAGTNYFNTQLGINIYWVLATSAAAGTWVDVCTPIMPCQAGSTYEGSVLVTSNTSSVMTVQLYIMWLDTTATAISYSGYSSSWNYSGSGSSPKNGDTSLMQRIGGFGVAPAGAVARRLLIRSYMTTAGTARTYITQPFSQAVAATQTILSPYSSGTQANITAINTLITNNATSAASQTQAVANTVSGLRTDFNSNVASVNNSLTTLSSNLGSATTQLNTLSANYGGGSNDIANSELSGSSLGTGGYDGWTNDTTVSGSTNFGINFGNYSAPGTVNVLYLSFNNTPSANQYADWISPSIPTSPNIRYEHSVLAAYHRASYAQILVEYFDSAGAHISYSYESGGTASGGVSGGGSFGILSNFAQIGFFQTSPSNVASRKMYLRVVTDGTEGSPYGFFTHPFSRAASSTQTVLSPYSAGSNVNVPAINALISTTASAAATANQATVQSITDFKAVYNANAVSVSNSITGLTNNLGSTVTQVNGLKATFGGGANDVANSDLNGIDGWVLTSTYSGPALALNSPGYYNSSVNTILVALPAQTAATQYADLTSPHMAAEPGVNYEVSVLCAGQNNATMQIYIGWINASNVVTAFSGGWNTTVQGLPANALLSNYSKIGGFAVAPDGTVARVILIRTFANTNNAAGTAFYTHPFSRTAPLTQTSLSPYSPGTQANVAAINAAITSTATAAANANTTTANSLTALQTNFNNNVTSVNNSIISLSNNVGANTTLINTLNANAAGIVAGGNMLANSELNGYDGWTFSAGTSAVQSGLNLTGWYSAKGINVLWINLTGTPSSSTVADWDSPYPYMPAQGGVRYECSVAAAYQHATFAQLFALCIDASGKGIQYMGGWSGGTPSGGTNGDLANFTRIGGFFTAPAGTCFVQIKLRLVANGTDAQPYGFFTQPFISPASTGQLILSPYTPGTQVNLPAVNASITSVANAAATATTAVSTRVDTLNTTVGNNSALISVLQSSTNGLSAKYAVALTLNGSTGGYAISGVQRADGTGAIFNMEINSNVSINGNLVVSGVIASGVSKLSDGTIVQRMIYGNYGGDFNDSGYPATGFYVSFPTSFPNACDIVVATDTSYGGASACYVYGIDSSTATRSGCVMYCNAPSGYSFRANLIIVGR